MAVDIDELQVRITASANQAQQALTGLANALKKVRGALTGVKDGATVAGHLSQSLTELNNSLNGISTGSIKKLHKLSEALYGYADAIKAIKNNKATASVSQSIKATEKALTGKVKGDSAVSEGGKADVDATSENMKKLGEETEKAGGKAKKATGFFGKFMKSIGRIMLYRAIRSALKAIGEALSEGLKNAYHYSQQSETFTRLADTLDRVKSITSQMVNQLGAFWGELRQFIMPAIEWIVEKVRAIAEWLTQLFAALNGEKTYLQAQYVAEKWDDATDSVKNYKHQLLGLDELNVLSDTKSGSKKKEDKDYSKLYKEVSVSPAFLKVGEAWGALTGKIKDALTEIEIALGGFMVGVGAALLFSGANIPLGLGLIVAGGFMLSKAIPEKWDEIGNTLEDKIGAIELLLGGFLLGVGAVLTFSGANIPLGIGLMIAGATSLAVGAATLNWDSLNSSLNEKIGLIEITIGGFALAVGSILALSGANIPLGIGLMAAGAVSLANGLLNLNWDALEDKVKTVLTKIALVISGAAIVLGGLLTFSGHFGIGIPLLAAGAASLVTMIAVNWNSANQEVKNAIALMTGAISTALLVLGCLLTFTGTAPAIGIPMIIAGAGGLVTAIAFNWDFILDKLKGAWEGIKSWWRNSVIGTVEKAVGGIEKLFDIDLNKDGTIGMAISTHESGSGTTHGGVAGKFATGGVPQMGSLFYAGEAGAEFVGNIGSTSAVANTGQMTEAIYKAAYMGMSKALKENGGGGMSGFEPATTDDLFIAMRKKASNYNKMTGNPAFA